MTERAQSNFVSGVLDSAWYTNHRGSSRTICRTTGFSLLANLKQNLRDTLQRTGPLPTSGGTTVSAEQIVILDLDPQGRVTGDGWTTDTLRGLFAVCQRARVSAVYTAAIQNDLQIGRLRPGRVLSTSTMQAAIWFAEESGIESSDAEGLPETHWGEAGSPSEVDFGSAILPGFGTVPEPPTNRVLGSAVCTPEDQSAGAQAPLHAQAGFAISDVLVILGLLGVAVGAAILTTGAPTRAEQREARRNPYHEMTPARRRYAISQRSRAELISLLKSKDPRGLYADHERVQAGLYPLTHTSASQLVHEMVS